MKVATKPCSYALLTDAAPADEGGHGCHVLARQWLTAVGEKTVLVVTHPPAWDVCGRMMTHHFGQSVCWYRVASRRLYDRLPFLTLVLLALQLRGISRQITASSATRLFAICGANFWYLASVWMIQKAVRLPLDIYLVDDMEESAKVQRRITPQWFIRALERSVLQGASRLYAISRGFAAHLNEKYSVSAQWLPIPITDALVPYHPHVVAPDNVRNIVFSGAVNHLYAAALRDLLARIEEWNKEPGPFPVRLQVLSYTPAKTVYEWIGKTSALEVLVGLDDAELCRLLRESWAVFLPYSFEDEQRTMVSTSFSTKFKDAITSGRPILVYGPAYASLPAYFLEEGLPLCCISKNNFVQVFHEIMAQDTPSLTEQYASLVKRNHSSEAIRKILGILPEPNAI